jgi:hypothetical protein
MIPYLGRVTYINSIVKERGYLWRNDAEMELALKSLQPS